MTIGITIIFAMSILTMLIASRKKHDNDFENWLLETEKELGYSTFGRDYIFLHDLYNENHLLTPRQAADKLLDSKYE